MKLSLPSAFCVALLGVMSLSSAPAGAETPAPAVHQTPHGLPGSKAGADAPIHETPQSTSRTGQASGTGSDDAAASGKRKLVNLEDLAKPKPVDSTVNSGAARALNVDKGVQGPKGGPVDPAGGH